MKPCLRISKKVRERVYRLWRLRPDLCLIEAAALLGYSEPELMRLTRRWRRAVDREYRSRLPKPAPRPPSGGEGGGPQGEARPEARPVVVAVAMLMGCLRGATEASRAVARWEVSDG